MDLLEQSDALPTEPGVYLFKDARGEVLYVGKARNLRARVKQYLGGHDERFMVRFLVAAARTVDVVPVHTEKEALLLENSLIKQYRPRFNSKLRDDKNFLHLRIDPREAWPRFTLTRRISDDGARTFGPYTSATAARRTLQFVQRAFPLRTCTDRVLATRKRPCLLHQMHRCVAPCAALCSRDTYDDILDDAMLFLSGKKRELLDRLMARMVSAAEEERYEDAARLRDLARDVQRALESQVVIDVKMGDRDAWALFREGDRGVVARAPVRGGMLLEPTAIPFEGELADDADLLASVITRWYDPELGGADLPPEILLPLAPNDPSALQELLSERRGAAVRVAVPQRGDKVRVLEIAEETARARYATTTSEGARIAHALEQLADIAGLELPPHRIECYDNSNLLGEDPVASQVVFLDGKPARKEYRRYKVRTVVGADDFATMAEILERRLKRALEQDDMPDLVVVDGGRGQLNAALAVRERLGLHLPPMIGLSKPRTERKRGDRDAVDKIVLPDAEEPVVLAEHHPTLRLLQHLRDEAHDTAVGFHRKQRSKSALQSQLEELPGVGKTRRVALVRHFGSVAAIRAATVEALAEAPGIGPALAKRIHAGLHAPREPEP